MYLDLYTLLLVLILFYSLIPKKCNDKSFDLLGKNQQKYMWPILFCFFVATDKFALLIGNYNYPNGLKFKTPETDVLTLARLFKKLQFKVIALLNLSKIEMLSIVDYFSELLDKGMYVVFYFCGLGFEENGCCYFVPTETIPGYTSHDCVSAELILNRLQVPDPDLIVMIIDVSRKKYALKLIRKYLTILIRLTFSQICCIKFLMKGIFKHLIT